MNSSNAAVTTAPYGAWPSPLTAQALASGRVSFGDLQQAGERLYWTETIPAEGGITALFSAGADGAVTRVSPEGSNVRSRVHEYGGAPYIVAGDVVYFTQYKDQRLYAMRAGAAPEAVTPAGYRFADCTVQHRAGKPVALICVREDHTDEANVRNAIVRLPLPAGGAGEVLYGDSDFVAYPRLSSDERRLAFISWNHPDMPWDGTALHVATLGDSGLAQGAVVAGGPHESVLDPQWDRDGALYYISDRSGFWNLYALGPQNRAARAVLPREADFASALWTLGQSNYALLGDGRALARSSEQGFDRLVLVDLRRGSAEPLHLPYIEYSQLTQLDATHVAVIAASAMAPPVIARLDVRHPGAKVLRSSGKSPLAGQDIAAAQAIDFPSANNRTAHAFYYPPTRAGYHAPAGEKPPLLTLVHGGPTSAAMPAYNPRIQFWTSRGFAVVDVNYGGSTGFGRRYREELRRNWGVVDVEDVVAAVRYLCGRNLADANRVAISGGSAGGYTVLAALAAHREFRAGADYYGVSDMTALAKDTHKFESRYLDSLIGPLPEAQAVYDERSPLNHLQGFTAPLLVLQGADDPVVPPAQSERIVAALRARHIPVAYLLFAGESHGFRKPENVIRALQAELAFYAQIFSFRPADTLPALAIDNLGAAR